MTEHVPVWPMLVASVNADGTGTLSVNGAERHCAAESLEVLRTGIIARCVAIANRLHRPVRLTVAEPEGTWRLAVRPEGIVQMIDDAGMIPPAGDLSVDQGRCRQCRRLQDVNETTCIQCGTAQPHLVDVVPPDRATVPHTASPAQATPARSSALHLRLHFSTQDSVDVHGNAAVGRDPTRVGARHAIAVLSPEGSLSRTHAFIDVDGHDRVMVTDQFSSNGVEALTTPPVRLMPGEPFALETGTVLRMGDVDCTPELVRDTPSLMSPVDVDRSGRV